MNKEQGVKEKVLARSRGDQVFARNILRQQKSRAILLELCR